MSSQQSEADQFYADCGASLFCFGTISLRYPALVPFIGHIKYYNLFKSNEENTTDPCNVKIDTGEQGLIGNENSAGTQEKEENKLGRPGLAISSWPAGGSDCRNQEEQRRGTKCTVRSIIPRASLLQGSAGKVSAAIRPRVLYITWGHR